METDTETPTEEKQEQPAEETPAEDKKEEEKPLFSQLSIEKVDNGYMVLPRSSGEVFVYYTQEEVLAKVKELLENK